MSNLNGLSVNFLPYYVQYVGVPLRSLEFEEQADVRQLVRDGKLRIIKEGPDKGRVVLAGDN